MVFRYFAKSRLRKPLPLFQKGKGTVRETIGAFWICVEAEFLLRTYPTPQSFILNVVKNLCFAAINRQILRYAQNGILRFGMANTFWKRY